MKILVVDDHPLILRGLSDFLTSKFEIDAMHTAINGKLALEVLEKEDIDIVLLDINMPVMDGFETLSIISMSYPKTKVIMVTFDNSVDSFKRALKDGAHGYILKEFAIDEVVIAINEVSEGKKYFSKDVNDALINDFRNLLIESEKSFTAREIEILELVTKGFSGIKIAKTLSVSARTVEVHRRNLMNKTNTDNSVQLAIHAYKNNLVKID